jgi:hypothetical protein
MFNQYLEIMKENEENLQSIKIILEELWKLEKRSDFVGIMIDRHYFDNLLDIFCAVRNTLTKT